MLHTATREVKGGVWAFCRWPRVGTGISLGIRAAGLSFWQGNAYGDGAVPHASIKNADLTCISPCAEKNLEALKGILERLPSNACLCFGGDGPSRPDLAKHFEGLPVYFTVSRMTFS